MSAQFHSFLDLVTRDWRDDSRVQYKYFGKCSGCQDQMLAYARQPQSGHFDARQSDWVKFGFKETGRKFAVDIGVTLCPVQECSIATPVLSNALGPPRNTTTHPPGSSHSHSHRSIWSYKKGASLPMDTTSPDDSGQHVCITSHEATVCKPVSNTYFRSLTHVFLQSTNATLVPLTDYVCEAPHAC